MIGFGFIAFLSGALQLTVPSYALRLVRHYGTRRVGWILVTSFGILALLHLFLPMGLLTRDAILNEFLFILGSALLVGGMMHQERLWAERITNEEQARELLNKCARRVEQTNSELFTANQALRAQVDELTQETDKLRQWGDQYRAIFDGNPLPMCVFDLSTQQLLSVNSAGRTLLGYGPDELNAFAVRQLIMPAESAAFQETIEQPCGVPEAHGCFHLSRRNRTALEAELTMLDVRFEGVPARLMVFSSVEEQRHEQTRLAARERDRAFNQVISGVAEHFSTLLAQVDSRATRLKHEPASPQAAEWRDELATASNRAVALTRQMTAAVERDAINRETLHLDRFVQGIYKMLQQLLGNTIMLRTSFDPGTGAVLADPRVMQQILVSLVLNARDAMPTGGNVLISTAFVRVEAAQLPRPGLQPGSYVRLSVRDTGCGMNQETQARLFEPFFTTKRRAFGMSLATANGYLRQHQGWFEVESQTGAGTEMHLYLPAAN